MPAKPLQLASGSPRRKALLEQIGVDFATVNVDVDETPRDGETPAGYVSRLSRAKAIAGMDTVGGPPAVVLAADTAVVIDEQILGKPRDRSDGLRMLRRLAGRQHQVYSAVALLTGDQSLLRLSVSEVTMRDLPAGQLERYWDSGEPADKAGAYAIQGLAGAMVSELRGSFSGVMGLPLSETVELLESVGIGWALARGVDGLA